MVEQQIPKQVEDWQRLHALMQLEGEQLRKSARASGQRNSGLLGFQKRKERKMCHEVNRPMGTLWIKGLDQNGGDHGGNDLGPRDGPGGMESRLLDVEVGQVRLEKALRELSDFVKNAMTVVKDLVEREQNGGNGNGRSGSWVNRLAKR